jgi:hypothetical protein
MLLDELVRAAFTGPLNLDPIATLPYGTFVRESRLRLQIGTLRLQIGTTCTHQENLRSNSL